MSVIPSHRINLARISRGHLVSLAIMLVYGGLMTSILDAETHYKYGVPQSVMLIMTAGQNFADEGFVASRLTPKIPVKADDFRSLGLRYYTHFPPLPYYIGGILFKLGVGSLLTLRWLYILTGAMTLAGVYVFASLYLGRVYACCVATFFAAHRFLYAVSGTAPEAISDALQVWTACVVLLAMSTSNTDRRSLWILAWLLYFLNSYSSFEHIVSLQIIITGLLLVKRPFRSAVRISFLMGVAAVAAQVIHVGLNVWALGGFKAAYDDLTTAFLWRTVGGGFDSSFMQQRLGGLDNYPLWLANTVCHHYLGSLRLTLVAATIAAITLMHLVWRERNTLPVRPYLYLVAIFALADVSYWLMFPQSTVVEFAIIGRHLLTTHALFFGGALYLLVRATWQQRHSLRMLPHATGVICVLLVFTSNADATASFLSSGSGERTWATELAVLREVSDHVEDDAIVFVSDEKLAWAAFYHQPRDFFGLGAFDVIRPRDWDEVIQAATPSANASYGDRPLYAMLSVPVQSPDVEEGGATFNLVALERQEADQLAPARTAASPPQLEAPYVGTYTGTYHAKVEVAVTASDPGHTTPAGGSYALRIASQGADRSGIQQSDGHFQLKPGHAYMLSSAIYSKQQRDHFRLGILNDTCGHLWARNPVTRSDRYENVPHTWTQLKGLVSVPDDCSGTSQLWIMHWDKVELTWYLGDVTLREATPGHVIAQIATNRGAK